jgi:hypothetical protein
MAACVELDTTNHLVATTTPPESCTAYVIQSQSDWAASQFPLWSLTPEQGTEIALAILIVWAIAYAIRQVAVALRNIDETSQSE